MPRLHQRNLLRATSIKLRATCCAGVNAALEQRMVRLVTDEVVDHSRLTDTQTVADTDNTTRMSDGPSSHVSSTNCL